jgi:hypothetical protein
MLKRVTFRLLVPCLVTGTLWAANDPLLGKWKLNPSGSKLSDQMKVEAAGAKQVHVRFWRGYVETVVADGTDQSGSFGTTVSVTVEGLDTWKVVRKKDGRMLEKGIWKLSKDGTTLSDDFTGYQPNGSTLNFYYVYKRTAGRSGFQGTWESTTENVNSVFELEIRPYEEDGLSFIDPAEDSTVNMKYDGKDYPNEGQDATSGDTSSGRRVDDRALKLTDKARGKVTDTRQIKLSTDGKILTMTMHTVGHSKPTSWSLIGNRRACPVTRVSLYPLAVL